MNRKLFRNESYKSKTMVPLLLDSVFRFFLLSRDWLSEANVIMLVCTDADNKELFAWLKALSPDARENVILEAIEYWAKQGIFEYKDFEWIAPAGAEPPPASKFMRIKHRRTIDD